MTDLPVSWAEAPMSEIAESCLGKMLDKAKNRGRPMPYLRNINVRWGAFNLSDLSTMPFEDDEGERYGLRFGDVIVCEGGEPGRCAVWDGQVKDMRIQKALHRVRPGPAVMPKWIALRLRHMAEGGSLTDYFTGTGIAHLTGDSLSRVPMPVPPVPEQRRIVAKLDALQSRTRLAREALAAIPALLDHYRQSVLAAAFRGELTAEWRNSKGGKPNDALASVRSERASTTQRLGVRCSDWESALPDTDADLEELPVGWHWVKGNALFRIAHGYAFKSTDYCDSGIPLIRQGDLNGADINIAEAKKLPPTLALELPQFVLKNNDLLIAMSGSLGKLGKYTHAAPALQNQRVGRFRWLCPTSVPSAYLELFAQTYETVLPMLGKGCAVQNVSSEDIEGVLIPVSSPEEMAEIARRVHRAFAWIEQIRLKASQATKDCGHLDQSLLATAFRGELVPQDPNDEPASVLLDRIRAARAQVGDAPRTRRPRAPAAPAPARAAEPAATYSAGDPYATLLAALHQHGSLSSSDAQAATSLDAAGVRPLLQRLVAEGAAKVEGQKRGTRYVVNRARS